MFRIFKHQCSKLSPPWFPALEFIKPDKSLNGTSLHFSLKTKMKTFRSVICDWFKFMFSIPRAKPMTMAQKFTMWSSLIFYCDGGLVLLIWVHLWKIIFRIDFQGRTASYIRLTLLGVFIIGFHIVIMARSWQWPKP